MKKLPSTLPAMLTSLICVTVFSGLVLGAMYDATKEPIARQEAGQKISAIRDVAPPFNNNPEADTCSFIIQGNKFTVFPARMDGRLMGAAVQGTTMNGFSGEILIMTGFNADGSVRDYRVLRHAETPGLGSKMEAWFRDPSGARSIIGKSPATTSFRVTKDGGDIDAITAATYSSRAFLEDVSNAYQAFRDYENKQNGDTSSHSGADAATGASRGHEKHGHDSADAASGASVQNHKHHKK